MRTGVDSGENFPRPAAFSAATLKTYSKPSVKPLTANERSFAGTVTDFQ